MARVPRRPRSSGRATRQRYMAPNCWSCTFAHLIRPLNVVTSSSGKRSTNAADGSELQPSSCPSLGRRARCWLRSHASAISSSWGHAVRAVSRPRCSALSPPGWRTTRIARSSSPTQKPSEIERSARMGATPYELPRYQCIELANRQTVGRLCIVEHGYPLAFPVNYRLVHTDGADSIVVRASPRAAIGTYEGPASFEVDQIDVDRA